jgi:glyoxylase-like metal-dependent hydrolase (beta-lactamase superfamily II)
MQTRRLNEYTYLIDLETVGYEGFFASYVLKGEKIAVIETGPTSSIPNLLAGLRKIGIREGQVSYVMLSHIHLDHAGGAGTLLQSLPNAKLIVHRRGAPHLVRPEKLWVESRKALGEIVDLYGQVQPISESRILIPENGMVIDLGEQIKLQIVETLGHASHHQSFYDKDSRTIFLGDAAGIYLSQFNAVIPTTPPPLRLEATLKSLEKLKNLGPELLCYTHFGQVNDAVNRLDAYKEQLKLWARTISRAVGRGDDLKTIYMQVLELDPAIRNALEFIKRNMMLRESVVLQSVQGFVSALQRNDS